MANELLDFVMSLVRDPEAAARYTDNPSQAIADAHLTDVTSADVNGLIPVVSDSLSMASPVADTDTGHDSNVWASGAATAAFDAFDDHVPAQTIDDAQHLVSHVVDQPADVADVASPAFDGSLPAVDTGEFVPPAPAQDFHVDDSLAPIDDAGPVDHPLIADHDFGADVPNFDIFE
jgi:hypothetical protein